MMGDGGGTRPRASAPTATTRLLFPAGLGRVAIARATSTTALGRGSRLKRLPFGLLQGEPAACASCRRPSSWADRNTMTNRERFIVPSFLLSVLAADSVLDDSTYYHPATYKLMQTSFVTRFHTNC